MSSKFLILLFIVVFLIFMLEQKHYNKTVMTNKDKLLNSSHLKHIEFIKDSHKYFYYKEDNRSTPEQYNGYTDLLGKYKQFFDRDGISKGVAWKENKTQKKVLAEWDEHRDMHIDYGNLIHDSNQYLMETGSIKGDCVIEIENIQETLHLNNLNPLVAEYLIYDTTLKRASSIDITCEKRKQIVPIDIKTYYKGVKYEGHKNKTMLAPLTHLQDCNFVHTSLQLSLYRYTLENLNKEFTIGLDVADEQYMLYVYHDQCHLLCCPYLKQEVEDLIEYET